MTQIYLQCAVWSGTTDESNLYVMRLGEHSLLEDNWRRWNVQVISLLELQLDLMLFLQGFRHGLRVPREDLRCLQRKPQRRNPAEETIKRGSVKCKCQLFFFTLTTLNGIQTKHTFTFKLSANLWTRNKGWTYSPMSKGVKSEKQSYWKGLCPRFTTTWDAVER